MLLDKTFVLAQCLGSGLQATTRLMIRPGDAITPYNHAIPVDPAAVVYPSTEQEVSSIVKCAAEGGFKVQARSGGHGYANQAYGSGMSDVITIDMVNFKQLRMDPSTWQADVGAGFQLGELDAELLANGNRAVAHGTCPSVGVGGHAVIGGLGPLSRSWGPLLDHVQEVRAVIANGSIVTASPTMNSDLFWAFKGAGANYGVVTNFKLRTQRAPGSMIRYKFAFDFGSWSELAGRFKLWQKFVSNPNLDRRFASMVIISPVGMIITGTFFGTEPEFRAMGLHDVFPEDNGQVKVFENWMGTISNWGEEQVLAALNGRTASFYSNSVSIRNDTLLPEKVIDDLFKSFANPKGTPVWFTIFDLAAGATNDVAMDATSYSLRDILFYMQSYAIGVGGVNKVTTNFFTNLTKTVIDGLGGEPLAVYPGYVDPLLRNAQQAYWGPNLPRLEKIKQEWDPQNVFRTRQSIGIASTFDT